MIQCNPIQEAHQKQIDSLFKHYNKSKLKDIYGEYMFNNSETDAAIREDVETLFLQRVEQPMNPDNPITKKGKLDLSAYNQVKAGIDRWANSLEKGINPIEAFLRSPSGIFSRDPKLQRFSDRFHIIMNNERSSLVDYSDDLTGISKKLSSVLAGANNRGLKLKTASKKLAKLSDAHWEASINGDTNKASEIRNEINNILESDDSKKVLKTFVGMMENMSKTDIDKFLSNRNNQKQLADNLKFDVDVVRELAVTVKDSKNLLEKMGNVNIKGLEKAKDIIDIVYSKTDQKNHVAAKNAIAKIDNTIDRMKEAIKEDKYFPHYGIESLIKLEEAIDNTNFLRISNDASYANRAMDKILNNLTVFSQETLASSKEKRSMFEVDPIKVIESYSQNAIAYNKKTFMTHAFLDAMKDIKPTGQSFDGYKVITEYLAQKYMAIDSGFIDASESVKQASAFISRAQTISKMGLSVTGAIRNSTQWFWYGISKGFKRYNTARKAFNSDFSYDFGDKKMTMSQMINEKSDQNESGFFFENVQNVSLETISGGAFFSLDGVDKRSIKYDFDENGEPVIRYNRNGVASKFNAKMAKATGTSLMFHQFTENKVRKAVYQNAFADYFSNMYNKTDYINSQIEKLGQKKAMNKLRKEAHNMAINWVRMTQFEYSTGDRALGLGGGTTNASVIGNSVFQFFPYASHMFEYNNKIIREGWDSLKMGDYDSYKVGAAARLIGFQTFGIGLASVLLNTELRYMIENDTWSRLEDLYTLMTTQSTEETFGRGLIAQMTGPVVSDALFWMEVGGLTDFSQGEIGALATGYYDYANKAQSEKDRMRINRVSVSLAKLHKSYDSLAKGDMMSVIRNHLLVYPSQDTREGRQYLMNMLGIPTAQGERRKQEENINQAILSLHEEQKNRILGVIQDLKKDSAQPTGVPAGTERLTPR